MFSVLFLTVVALLYFPRKINLTFNINDSQLYLRTSSHPYSKPSISLKPHISLKLPISLKPPISLQPPISLLATHLSSANHLPLSHPSAFILQCVHLTLSRSPLRVCDALRNPSFGFLFWCAACRVPCWIGHVFGILAHTRAHLMSSFSVCNTCKEMNARL